MNECAMSLVYTPYDIDYTHLRTEQCACANTVCRLYAIPNLLALLVSKKKSKQLTII